MKIQNSILSMGLAVALLASCSTEDIVDRPRTTDGPVSVVFYRTAMQTKADKAGNYEYATDEELNINSYTIAVFEGTVLSEDAVCIKLVSGTTSEASTTVDAAGKTVTAYSVSLTDLPAERNLQFLLIANAGTVPGQAYVGKRYGEFKSLIENTSSFRPEALVKAGKAEARFEVSATPQEVKIPLIQLSARLDFGGVTVEGGNTSVAGPATVVKKIEVKGGSTKEELEIPSEIDIESAYYLEIQKNQKGSYEFDADRKWYTYGVHNSAQANLLYLYRQAVVQETETETWKETGKQFVFEMDRLEGVNFRTDLTIFSTSEIENRQNKEGEVLPNQENRFYTYENCHLRFVFTGAYRSADEVTKQRARTREMVIEETAEYNWNEEDGRYYYIWREPNLTDIKHFRIVREGEWSGWSAPVTVSDTRSAIETKAASKQFELVIDRDKIKKGHVYRITGKGTPALDFSSEIAWKVEDMTPEEVIIPGFE